MRTMVFFSYWGLGEPLTQATVRPTLEMVLKEELVDRVVLCTMERNTTDGTGMSFGNARIVHELLHASTLGPKALSRGVDAIRAAKRLATIAVRERAGFIMARGVVAGGIAHFAARRSGVPYAVDYFEPHADYMVDAGEWNRSGFLYKGLRRSIAMQLRSARYQITVSRNYRNQLIAAGAEADRLLVAPCPVDAERMRFDDATRERKRIELGWSDAIIGIYVGKFGGLYHREASYRAFARAQRLIGSRYAQIILSPEPREVVLAGLREAGFDTRRASVHYAQHKEVSAFLSASDFAFAPYKGTPSSACISPMKVGEYWANGLPVLLTRGVGDDSGIIASEPLAGALFDPPGDDLERALAKTLDTIARPGQRLATSALADRYRSMDITRDAYKQVLKGAWAE